MEPIIQNNSPQKKPAPLGRGLAALLGDEAEDYAALDRARAYRIVGIELLQPSSAQPRRDFREESLLTLADSLKEHGMLQPLTVRRLKESPNRYEIIAGERRWRAAQKAGLHQVPVVVKEISDREALHIALIENMQREDLNPIEEAQGMKRLMNEFGDSQEDVAKQVGKSRSYVSNAVRLLELPESVQGMLRAGELTMGHAKALVASDFPEILARQIVDRKLSVRDAEALAAQSKQTEKDQALKAIDSYLNTQLEKKGKKDPNIAALEKDLSNQLGLKVRVDFTPGGKKGKLVLHYSTLDQFDDIVRKLKG